MHKKHNVFFPLDMRVPTPYANLPKSLASACFHVLELGPLTKLRCSNVSSLFTRTEIAR